MRVLKDCALTACGICTGCYHGHHERCSRVVHCPDTGRQNACRCCGDSA